MKIVIRGTNWIGDSVMTIPAMRELRRMFADAHISLHTHDWAKGIFQDADFIDEIIPFEKETSSIQTVLKQSKTLRDKEFDLAILFTNSFRSALISKLGRVKKRIGYKNEGRSILLSSSFEKPTWKNKKHEIFYYLNLLAEVEKDFFGKTSILDNKIKFELEVSKIRRENAREILVKNKVDLNKKTIALGVGSTNSMAKRWQTKSFAKLNDLVKKEFDANLILIGSENELDVSNEVFEKATLKPTILTSKTSLSEVTAILAESDLLISNDMGLAHVSTAVGTKTLTIFGPTNPKTTHPWNAEIIRRNDVECSPCMLRECPIDHRCMTRISPNDVFEKAKSLIKSK